MIDESLGEEREEFGGSEGETERLVGQDMECNGLVTTGLVRRKYSVEAKARNADLAANVADVDEKKLHGPDPTWKANVADVDLHGPDPTWKDILISETCSLVGIFGSFVEEMRKETRVVNEPEM